MIIIKERKGFRAWCERVSVQNSLNALKLLGGDAAMLIIPRLCSTIKLCLHLYVRICCLHKCIKFHF